MTRTPVISKNIRSIGYAEATETLEVQFVSGAVYQYFDVPSMEYDGLMESQSKGKYFAEDVRNKYKYTKVQA